MAAAYRAYFVDSSALVKRYVQETGTPWVRRLTRHNPSTIIYIARIKVVEVTSAVARRRRGTPPLAPSRASSLLRRYRRGADGRRPEYPSLTGLISPAGGSIRHLPAPLNSYASLRSAFLLASSLLLIVTPPD